MKDYYYSWAWSPDYVRRLEERDQATASGLILPTSSISRPEEEDAAVCHFSTMKDGEQYSWLWLFDVDREAVALRMLPQYLRKDPLQLVEDETAVDVIRSTLPSDTWGKPEQTYLQLVPLNWLKTWDYAALGIQEIWLGFDYKTYRVRRRLEQSTQRFSPDEFLERMRRSA